MRILVQSAVLIAGMLLTSCQDKKDKPGHGDSSRQTQVGAGSSQDKIEVIEKDGGTTAIEYYDSGKKRSEIPLDEAGEPHGDVLMWHENGQLRFRVEYTHGKRHGSFQEWYANGQQLSERSYRNGARHGAFKDWHENGKKAAEGLYEEDTIVKVTEWDENGDEISR